MDLKRFMPGEQYEVGSSLGAVLLAEGWAEPVAIDEPGLVVPFSESDPFMARVMDASSPPNLVRETHPPYTDQLAIAPDLERRKRRRSKD